jgi:hypothetical protein
MRFDFTFSYWIFIWYVLYILRVTTFTPKIALVLGVIHNILLWLIMFYYKNDWIHIVTFFLINLCIKGIPLWTVRNDPYRWKDFYALVVYFIMYIIWLFVNDQLHTRGIEKGLQQIKDNVPSGPFMQFVDKSIRV